jgi:hypothetical protein
MIAALLKRQWINRDIVDAYFVMQVRARAIARIAAPGQYGSPANLLADNDIQCAQVGVIGDELPALDYHQIPVANLAPPGKDDLTTVRGNNAGANMHTKIDPDVPTVKTLGQHPCRWQS